MEEVIKRCGAVHGGLLLAAMCAVALALVTVCHICADATTFSLLVWSGAFGQRGE